MIQDEEGRVWHKKKEISAAFIKFYQNLLSLGEEERIEQCLGGMEGRVTEEMNMGLMRTYTEDEVDTALNQMHPLKSPGPMVFQHVSTNDLGP
jgi:hypothetical protein